MDENDPNFEQDGEDADEGDDLLRYLPRDLFMDLADEDLVNSEDELETGYDETEEQETARADLMEQAVRRLYGRNRTEADIRNLVHATVRHFHPDRRFDECPPSMMLRRRQLVDLTDLHPTDNIVMETDEDDDLLQRIRCLRHSERPSLQMYDMWIGEHRHNPYTNEIECTLVRGLVTTGVLNVRRTPNSYPLTGRHSRRRILWTSNRMQESSIPGLDGYYASAMTHHFPDAVAGQGEHQEIGVYPLSQIREMYPYLGVLYALHYQLLESNEAQNWHWIRSYIQPIPGTRFMFQLRSNSL
jgi:hypothetical protein